MDGLMYQYHSFGIHIYNLSHYVDGNNDINISRFLLTVGRLGYYAINFMYYTFPIEIQIGRM